MMGTLRCKRCGVRMYSAGQRIYCEKGPCPMESEPNLALWITVGIVAAAMVILLVFI